MSYDILLKNAVALHQAGRLDEAENEYRRLLESTPDNPDVLHLLGMLATQKGAFESGIPHLFAAVKLSPETVAYRFTLAHALFAAGHPHEALEHYQEVIKRDPTLPDTYNNIGSIYQTLGDFAKAETNYQKALSLSPDYAPAFINEGALKRAEGKTDEALAFFDKAIAAAPEDADGYAQKALTLREVDRPDEALTYYDKALNIDDTNAVVTNGRGIALEALGRTQDALVCYDKAISLFPRYADAYNNRANVYVKLGKKWDAEDDYKKALTIDPRYVQAMTNLGSLLFQTERYEESLEYYRKALILNPKQPEALNNLAMAVKMSGDYEEAVGLFFDALVLAPALKTVHHNLAVTLFELYTREKKPDEARKLADKWAQSYPDNAVARHLSAAFSGKAPKEQETAYLKEFFDAFADAFDPTLEALQYRLPVVIRTHMATLFPVPQKATDILDAGCGTGLCGKSLRPFAEHLTGVDFSPKMLEKARLKGLYDTLEETDLITYQSTHPDTFDVIVAADVACYAGDLTTMLTGAHTALRTGGYLLFSIEKSEKEEPFSMLPTGRVAHRRDAVESLLTKTGFTVMSVDAEVLRLENDAPVDGFFFVARKGSSGQNGG